MSNINKVIVNGSTILDITKPVDSATNLGGNTAQAADVLEGKYFYDANGARTPGQLKLGDNKKITANGTYVASADGVAAYKKVEVDVPIPDGYFKPEGTYAINENGTYSIAPYDKVQVKVVAEEGEGGGGFDTSDATATGDDIRFGKTAYIADGLTSGTIRDFEGETEEIEGGEKVDGFFKQIGTNNVNSLSPDVLYKIRDQIALKDVFVGYSLEQIQQNGTGLGIISKFMSGGKKGVEFPIRAVADLPEVPLFSNSYTYYLYLYDKRIVGREVKTTAYFWNAGAPQYNFSSETDTQETILATLRAGGYLLATVNDIGPLYRVYPAFTYDGVVQLWADRDEDTTLTDQITGSSATFFHFYPYSFDKCGSMKSYFIEACKEKDLPEGVYWAASKDYWQPVSCFLISSSSSTILETTEALLYGGIICEDIDGTLIYDYAKEDFTIDETATPPGSFYFSLITLNSYYYQPSKDNDGETAYGILYGLDNCLPGGVLSSVVMQDGVFPNDTFYYKDGETIFLHESVQTASFLPKETTSKQFYCKADAPNKLYRGSLIGFQQPYNTTEYAKTSFAYSFTREESPLSWYILDEDNNWQEARVVEISYSVDNYYGDASSIMAETENYQTSWRKESAYAGGGNSLVSSKKNAETGKWEEFYNVYNDTIGEIATPPSLDITVVGDVPENMRDYFVGYYEPQSYDEYVLSTATALPTEISTAAEMKSQLQTAKVGSVFKYTGETTSEFENGELYVVEEDN